MERGTSNRIKASHPTQGASGEVMYKLGGLCLHRNSALIDNFAPGTLPEPKAEQYY